MQGLANFLAGAIREASDFTENERLAQRKREDDEIGRRRGVLDELKRGVEEGRVHPYYYAQIIKDIDTLGQGMGQRRAKKGGAGFFGASETPVAAIFDMLSQGQIPISEDQRGPKIDPPERVDESGAKWGYLPGQAPDTRKPAFLIDPMDQLKRKLEITRDVNLEGQQEKYDFMYNQLIGSGVDPEIAGIYASGRNPQRPSTATGSVFQRITKQGQPVTARIDPNSQQVVFVGDATIGGHHYSDGEPIPPGLTDPLPFRQQQFQSGFNMGVFNPLAPPGTNPYTVTNTPGAARPSQLVAGLDPDGSGKEIHYYVPPTVGGVAPQPVPVLFNGQSIFRAPGASGNSAARAAAQALLNAATKNVDAQLLSITMTPDEKTRAVDAELDRLLEGNDTASSVRGILRASVSGGLPPPPPVRPPAASAGAAPAAAPAGAPKVGDRVGNPPVDPNEAKVEAFVMSDPSIRIMFDEWMKEIMDKATEQEKAELKPFLTPKMFLASLTQAANLDIRRKAGVK